MTQLFAGVATIVLAIIFYGLGRKPSKPLLSSTDVSEVVALNRAQVELVQQEEVEKPLSMLLLSPGSLHPPLLKGLRCSSPLADRCKLGQIYAFRP